MSGEVDEDVRELGQLMMRVAITAKQHGDAVFISSFQHKLRDLLETFERNESATSAKIEQGDERVSERGSSAAGEEEGTKEVRQPASRKAK